MSPGQRRQRGFRASPRTSDAGAAVAVGDPVGDAAHDVVVVADDHGVSTRHTFREPPARRYPPRGDAPRVVCGTQGAVDVGRQGQNPSNAGINLEGPDLHTVLTVYHAHELTATTAASGVVASSTQSHACSDNHGDASAFAHAGRSASSVAPRTVCSTLGHGLSSTRSPYLEPIGEVRVAGGLTYTLDPAWSGGAPTS